MSESSSDKLNEKEVHEAPLSKTLGLPIDTASALTYSVFWVTGILFLVLEKDKQVRFHALQSIATFGILQVVMLILGSFILLQSLNQLIWIVMFVLWLVLIYRTLQGEKWLVPYVGSWAEKQVSGMK